MPYELRDAVLGDEVAILGLIKELALYEKEPHKVINTEDNLRKHQFEEKICEAMVVHETSTESIVGFALYYGSYSTWRGKCLYLEDLYLQPEHRRSGMGTVLFDEFERRARERQCNRIDWVVLDWNEPGLQFYRKRSARLLTDWYIGQVDLTDETSSL